MKTIPKCPECRKSQKQLIKIGLKGFSCETQCQKPVLFTENSEAFSLFLLLRKQIRVDARGTPLGLDFNAVRFVFDLYDVDDQKLIFEKLLVVSDEVYGEGHKSKNKGQG